MMCIKSGVKSLYIPNCHDQKKAYIEAENWWVYSVDVKGRSILFNHFIDMRTTVNLSISWNGQTNGCSHVYKMIK